MPRNDREGIHLPFCLIRYMLSLPNFPVNWAKDEPDSRRGYPSKTKQEEKP